MRASFIVAMAATLLAGSAVAQYTSPSSPPSAVEAPKTDKAPAASQTQTDKAPAAQHNEHAPAAPGATQAQAPAAPQAGAQKNIPPAAEGPQNPAVRTTEGNTAAAPVAGANSFTEGEAKSRIEARGFANVTELMKDDQGIWRGKAQQNGRSMNVALDYQGNVFGEPSS